MNTIFDIFDQVEKEVRADKKRVVEEGIDHGENAIDEALKIVGLVRSWGYSQVMPIEEIMGYEIGIRMARFISLYGTTQDLINNNDYWEAINLPVPSDVLKRMRETPELSGLCEYIYENGNGNW